MVFGKNYEVYTDDKEFIKEGEIQEVQFYSYLYQQTIDGIKVKLFASKNGVLLLQRYLDVIVQPDELVLFLEIKGDLDFNTVMHVKPGTDLTHRKDLPFKEIINFSNLHKVEISGAKIKNLIEKEIYKDKHSFMRWFFTITNALAGNLFSFFTKDIVKEGAEGFKTIASKIQEYRIDENRWNPEPKEGKYNPIFIPDEYAIMMEKAYLHQEYANPNQNVKAQRNIITQISKNFFDELSHAKSFALDTLKDAKQYLPTVLYNKLQSIVRYVFSQIASIEKAISDPFAALGQLIYKKQKITNAFLCGVYNSIIDIIAGIFSLVALLFEAVYTIKDVEDQTLIYAEMLVELFENMAEGILNFNFAEFFFNWITFEIKTLFSLITFIEKLGKTSLEKYAYYYGYIVGIVIDIIVETLLTGGVAAVEKLLQSVEAFLRNPLQKIVNAIEKSAIFVENILQKIINFLDFLAKKLKKGATEFFKDLEKIINEIFGFGEEVADHALTPSEKRYKDNLKAQKERIERKNRRKTDDVEIGGVSKKLSSIWKINLKEGKYNCANCVIATDATLAGRPASALPYTIQKRFRNGKWENYASYRRGTEPKVLETEFGAKFSDWATNLDDLVKDLKPGKRGVVFGYKKGADVGHVFNVVNEKGVIKYLDGQTGKRAKLVYDQYKFLPTN